MRIFALTTFEIVETVRVVMFAPVKTLSDPTFPEVMFADAVFRVTALALKRLESSETVS